MFEFIKQTIQEQINSNQFLSGGLILGALTSVLYSLKWLPNAIWNRIKRRIYFELTVEQNSDLYPFVQRYLLAKYKKEFKKVKAAFFKSDELNGYSEKRELKENGLVLDQLGDHFIVRKGLTFINIRSYREKMENASAFDRLYSSSYEFSGLFAKYKILKMIDEIITYNNDKLLKKIEIKTHNNWGEWHSLDGAKFRNIDNVITKVKCDLLKDIDLYRDSKDFYLKRDIPYRRGYLFHGPPGTGKSSLASALAKYVNMDLYILNLRFFDGETSFESCLTELRGNSILLIEDIDSYFSGRETKTKISFSSFINAISGVKSKEDTILIITTNKMDELDPALIRSGRIDVKFELDYPTVDEVNEYLSRFYETNIKLTYIPEKTSMADIENICLKHKFEVADAINEIKEKVEKALYG